MSIAKCLFALGLLMLSAFFSGIREDIVAGSGKPSRPARIVESREEAILLYSQAIAETTAPASAFLSDRHLQRGTTCVDCHGPSRPGKGTLVEMATCMKCHGEYDKVAERTKNLGKRNPHDSHIGQLDCTVCHQGHLPAELYCTKCHADLDLKVR
jgi:hypothetical protein